VGGDQLLLAWLKANNEAFWEKASIQVQAPPRNARVDYLLNKETLEKLDRRWVVMREVNKSI
jgi:hypothetical protein